MLFRCLFFLLLTLFSCSRAPVPDTCQPRHSAGQLLAQLEAADSLGIRRFCQSWQQDLPPSTLDFIQQNDTIQALFDLYAQFRALRADNFPDEYLSTWDWIQAFDQSRRYLLVPDQITYAVLPDTSLGQEEVHSNYRKLEGFRPPFPQAQARVLYLSTAYRCALDTFLGRAGGVFYQPYQPSDTLHQRLEKHWDLLGQWVAVHRNFGLLRAPNIRRIDLNETLTRACLHYSFFGKGGIARFERQGHRWQLKSLALSWIE
ncbi:MAG: hypothetical protein IT260_00630 [Saprospiraceae bacterium]|nr:hypothetical protein [Saprospiraceae bacterium]